MADKPLTPAQIDAKAEAKNQAELKRQQALDRLAEKTKQAVAEAKKK